MGLKQIAVSWRNVFIRGGSSPEPRCLPRTLAGASAILRFLSFSPDEPSRGRRCHGPRFPSNFLLTGNVSVVEGNFRQPQLLSSGIIVFTWVQAPFSALPIPILYLYNRYEVSHSGYRIRRNRSLLETMTLPVRWGVTRNRQVPAASLESVKCGLT